MEIAPLCWLLSAVLLQLAVLTHLCHYFTVDCRSLTSVNSQVFDHHVREETDTSQEKIAKIIRKYKLYNQCSGNYLQIIGQKVTAKGRDNSPYVTLYVETETFGSRIRIKSEKSGLYLCFSKKGKLIIRFNGNGLGCVFAEQLAENMHTELQSAYNPDWFVGFNRKGKPLEGAEFINTRRRSCFQFLKVGGDKYEEFSPNKQPGPDVDFAKLAHHMSNVKNPKHFSSLKESR